jgi:membrane protein DedA with SNARE-associated domain
VAAGSGAALGELSGYLAGFSGQGVVQRVKWHAQLEDWMRRYGDITILVLSFVPNPAFDVAGITAGALKLPLYRFLFWCWLGKVIKMLVFAYGGSTILNFVFPRG